MLTGLFDHALDSNHDRIVIAFLRVKTTTPHGETSLAEVPGGRGSGGAAAPE